MKNQEIQVGSLVIARVKTGVCDPGERGVCYEQYDIDGRPGWSFIFESGRYDGFSPDEVADMLKITGEVCEAVAGYEFKNVLRLCEDFRRGVFVPAFP